MLEATHHIHKQNQKQNAGLLLNTLSLLSYNLKPNPGDDAAHSGLDLPTSNNAIKTIPTDTPQGQPDLGDPSLRLSSQGSLYCLDH